MWIVFPSAPGFFGAFSFLALLDSLLRPFFTYSYRLFSPHPADVQELTAFESVDCILFRENTRGVGLKKCPKTLRTSRLLVTNHESLPVEGLDGGVDQVRIVEVGLVTGAFAGYRQQAGG
jgi:hypothetical protein